ncbi:hypothetical protein F511_36087 [Dorcoceras hygrometricum]|uniref:Uncharacterized protein n=1 Tax=Dorcoceras hygrometricum TaxID=472368 RepID=A0A2Z7CNA2_9LAMI|nr:hypothetical protein F511_36087 [Dorcoceras hygrometricum]
MRAAATSGCSSHSNSRLWPPLAGAPPAGPPPGPAGPNAFTRVFGISSSVIVLSLRYGFELVLRRDYGLDELLRGRAVIPHSYLPAGIVATMRRVVNYHSAWARQQQVELFDASGNPGSTAGRGFNPAGGAPGGG